MELTGFRASVIAATCLLSAPAMAQSVPSCFWTAACYTAAWASKADVGGFGKLTNGTAAAPALTFQSDSTTGLYYDPATNSLDSTVLGLPVTQFTQQGPIPSSKGTWLGNAYYPVPGYAKLGGLGHSGLNGYTRGWGASANVFEVFANDVSNFCSGAMGCYNVPSQRTYAGQDGAAMYVSIQGFPAVGLNIPVSTITPVTISTGATVYTLTLSTPLSGPQIAAILPLQKVETDAGQTGYFGYTIANGVTTSGGAVVPIISTDGTKLTVDGLTNSSGTQLNSISAGTQIAIDVLHQIDDVYFAVHLYDTDTVTTSNAFESAIINDKSTVPSWSNWDPNGDSLLINGFYMPVVQDNGTGTGLGGSAFMASDSGSAGTWKRAFSCRNRAITNSGPTYCSYNAFSTYASYSTAPTSWGGFTDYALLVQPEDLSFATTASITQAGAASFSALASSGGINVTAPNGAYMAVMQYNGLNQLLLDNVGNLAVSGYMINHGMQLTTTNSQPSCISANRSLMWVVQGASGVPDQLEYCKQTASGYSWSIVTSSP